jgi:dTDP-4-dehydrorhamnose reductase
VRHVAPDVIVHCAALADHRTCEEDPSLAMRVNAQASGDLASIANDAKSRFVHISTDAVFSGEDGWYAESDPVSPTSAYGRSKAEAEEAVLAMCPTAVVARTNFFGWSPSGARSILEFFVRELAAGNRVPGFVNYTVTSLFVEDVVSSIETIVGSGESGVFHVVARDAMAKAEFGRLVAAEFGFDASLIDPVRMDGPDKNLSLRSDRLADLRGEPMPSQAEGVARARATPPF